ncbi:MAG: DUF3795 domain-containing protein [Candidatus Aminicenantes bacterium]|nr:DUF3795 domain-containing protein [Candidatus Aminicenantes bacterium]
MKSSAYKRVKDQVGFCGIWCGSCIVGNGTLKELTGRYEKVIRDYDLENWAPKTFDFKEFLKGLAAIKATPLCVGCRKGGGWDTCPMRGCVVEKKIADCAECNDQAACPHSASLEKMRTGSVRAGLFVKTRKGSQKKLVAQWATKLKTRWPSSVLFLSDGK